MRLSLFTVVGFQLTISLLFVCAPLLLHAQTSASSIRQLEGQLMSADGVNYLNTATTLSAAYRHNGAYDRAIRLAQNAYDKARQLNDKYFMALALNHEGAALIEKGIKKGKVNRRRAASVLHDKFARSLELLKGSEHKEIKLDNLEWLQKAAEHLGNKRLASQYSKQIELMKDGLLDEPIAIRKIDLNAFKSSGEAEALKKDIFNKSRANNKNLTNQVGVLKEEREKLEAEKELLATERVLLEKEMEAQRVAINELSQEQMENELLISHQRILMDSLLFARQIDSFRLVQQQSELRQQESELTLERTQRNLLIALIGIVLLIAIGVLIRYVSAKKHNEQLADKNEQIRNEQSKAEALLLNILPASIAAELKKNGIARPNQHDQVTVMFTDFKDFSTIAEQLTPDELVNELHHCFKAFDEIIQKYQLEKIKTIGDAYMCAGGLPAPDPTHPERVVAAALEIQQFLEQWDAERKVQGRLAFQARIGIHTGPVVAGIVGIKKFAYDIWGDTVNIASRMESNGAPGKVNISSTTYDLVKEKFQCQHRGKLPTRKDGDIEMYFVENSSTTIAIEV